METLVSNASFYLQGERYNANYVYEQSGVLLHRQGETAIQTIIICFSERDPPPTSVNDTGLLFHFFYLVLYTYNLLAIIFETRCNPNNCISIGI
jgi:hypothetical protein